MSTSILTTTQHQTLLSSIVKTTIFTNFKLHPSSPPAINSTTSIHHSHFVTTNLHIKTQIIHCFNLKKSKSYRLKTVLM